MAIEEYLESAVARTNSPEKCKSEFQAVKCSGDNTSAGFDCNICLESVQDPVVTLCGHLYCWPCIYKWLHFQRASVENQDQRQLQCPVCKAEVSDATLVPIYGRGSTAKPSKNKAPHLGIIIPRRPLGPACGSDSPRSPSTASPRFAQRLHPNHSHEPQMFYPQTSYQASPILSLNSTTSNVLNPVIGMFGEMVYARVFGNSVTNMYTYPNSYNLVGSSSPRIRRHMMQADKSLSRICFFLFCCFLLCLLLF